MQTLHSILYENPGKASLIKKNLKKFAGFEFDAESEDFEKRLEATEKIDVKKLAVVAEILCLDKKGTKEDLAERICTFLLKPEGEEELPEEEGEDEEEAAEDEEEEEVSEEETKKKTPAKRPPPKSSRDGKSGGRPKRSTAGRGYQGKLSVTKVIKKINTFTIFTHQLSFFCKILFGLSLFCWLMIK